MEAVHYVLAHQHCWCCDNKVEMKMTGGDFAVKRAMTWECKDCQVLLNAAPCRSDLCERGLGNPGGTLSALGAVS